MYLIAIYLLILLVLGLVGAAVANEVVHFRLRKLTPDSVRRDSLVRWNRWTLGGVYLGGIVLAAVLPEKELSPLSAVLRRHSRRLLSCWLICAVLLSLVGLARPNFILLLAPVSLLAAALCFWGLRKQLQGHDTRLSEPLQNALVAIVGFAVAALVTALLVVVSAPSWALAISGLFVGSAWWAALVRSLLVVLLVGLEAKGPSSTDDTSIGAKAFGASIVWMVSVPVLVGTLAALLRALLR